MWPAFEELEFHPLIHLEKPLLGEISFVPRPRCSGKRPDDAPWRMRRRSARASATPPPKTCVGSPRRAVEPASFGRRKHAVLHLARHLLHPFAILLPFISRSFDKIWLVHLLWRPPGAVEHQRVERCDQRPSLDGALQGLSLHRDVLPTRRAAGALHGALRGGASGGGGAVQRGLPGQGALGAGAQGLGATPRAPRPSWAVLGRVATWPQDVAGGGGDDLEAEPQQAMGSSSTAVAHGGTWAHSGEARLSRAFGSRRIGRG